MTIIGNVPRDASPALIGRQAELEQLQAAWERAARGEPLLILIGGDAGIGKTRLLREYLSRGAGDRVTATGGCVPVAGGSLPYAPFAEMLRVLVTEEHQGFEPGRVLGSLAPATRAELGRLVPALRSADSSPTEGDDTLARARLFLAVRALIARIAAESPTLLVVEDLHWADGSSLDLLAYLIRNLDTEPVLLLVTYRTDELHRRHPLRPWIAESARLERTERLALERLGQSELRQEITDLLGPGADKTLVERIVARSEGNPLFVTELVASAVRGGDPLALPETLRDGFIDRIERLRPDALTVARHTAAIGRPASPELLGASTGLAPDRLEAALREALDTSVLVTSTGATFEPRHALLGEAILGDLLPVERSAVHRRLADVLESGADDLGAGDSARIAAEIAHHRWEARDVVEAVAASVRAALAATEARAYAEADGQWTRALEAWPDHGRAEVDSIDQAGALVRAAEAAAAIGDDRRAGHLAEKALGLIDVDLDPLRAAEVHRRIIWYHLHIDWRSAVIHSGRAVRLIPPGVPPPEAARILADRAVLLALRLHVDRAEPMARRALELAERYQRRDAEVQALHALGVCLASRSELTAAIETLTRGYDLAHRIGLAEGIMNTGLGLGFSLNDAGLWTATLDHCDRAEARIRELGLVLRYGEEMVFHRLWALLSLGRWADVEAIGGAVLATGGEREIWACGPYVLLRVWRGQLEEARRLTSLAGTVEEVNDIEPLGWHLDLWCQIALADGDWARVRQVVETAFARVPVRARHSMADLRPFVLYGLKAEAELAFETRIRRDTEAEAEAIAVARELEAWMRDLARRVTEAGEPLAATTLADTAFARALLMRAEHRPDPEAWRLAVEGYEALGDPYVVAEVRRWRAEAILEAGGSRSEAASELRLALATAVELGATILERAIRELARRARLNLGEDPARRIAAEPDARHASADAPSGDVPGAGAARSGRGQPATELVEPLTPREREVLGYVASGWTNRRIGEALFISDKTVGVHVSNLMGKLGAANRAEAALIGDRLGLVGSTEQP